MSESALLVEAAESWLRHTIRNLVDSPDVADVRVFSGEHSTAFEVTCDPADVRRLIGKKGSTADAIRLILYKIGGKDARQFHLIIFEPDRGPEVTRGRVQRDI